MTELTSVLSTVLSSIGTVIAGLFTETGALSALLPYFMIGIACSLVFLAVKAIRSLVWGA